jgi:hypothetical protein
MPIRKVYNGSQSERPYDYFLLLEESFRFSEEKNAKLLSKKRGDFAPNSANSFLALFCALS